MIVRRAGPALLDAAPITLSSFASLIPRTPAAVLPMFLTSDSLKRMDFPFAVASIISSPGTICFTSTRVSPSCNVRAIIPPLLGWLKAERGVFFTVPFSVAMKREPSSKFFTTILEVTLASSSSSRFTMGFPLEYLPASGIRYVLSQCTFPLSVKKRIYL